MRSGELYSQLRHSFPYTRVSSKQTKIIFGSNRNKPKQDLFRVCFVKPTKTKSFGLFRCFEPLSKQPKQTELFRNKPKQTETNRNNPKFSEKYPNILSLKLFGLVFRLFRINQNSLFRYRSETTETPEQTVWKQTEKTEEKPAKKRKNREKKRKKPKKPIKP
jgi:hypothetical protein